MALHSVRPLAGRRVVGSSCGSSTVLRPAMLARHRAATVLAIAQPRTQQQRHASASVAAASATRSPAPAQHHDAPLPSPPSALSAALKGWLTGASKVLGIAAVALTLMLGRADAAHAARTAGRAGGFSAPPSASRSYGGGGGGGGSYGGGRGYSGGGAVIRGGSGYSTYGGGGYPYSPFGGYRTAPPVVIAPSPPVFLGPSIGGGFGMAPVVTSVAPGRIDFVDVVLVTMFLGLAASSVSNGLKELDGDSGSSSGGGRATLTKIQVGLLASARERGLKDALERIAERADTSSSSGLHSLLVDVVLELMRNPSYAAYAAASQQRASGVRDLEAAFNKASLQERSKYEAETLVNVGGRGARRTAHQSLAKASAPDELIVVTLTVATMGKVDLPKRIDTLSDLKDALAALGGVPPDQVAGVELTFTPEEDGDVFTKEDLAADFPELRML